MIGPFLTRGLVLAFGYAYPAYACYKAVEKNKPGIEQLRFWCQYWILVALLTVCERFGDAFVSWVPFYSEAKVVFFVYLWYPKTKGTTFVYDSFFRPCIARHESEIDRKLMEIRTRVADIFVLYMKRCLSYGQTRVYEILQYIAYQSTPSSAPVMVVRAPRPPPAQPKPQKRALAAKHLQVQDDPVAPPALPPPPPSLPPPPPEEPTTSISTSSSKAVGTNNGGLASQETSDSATSKPSSSSQVASTESDSMEINSKEDKEETNPVGCFRMTRYRLRNASSSNR